MKRNRRYKIRRSRAKIKIVFDRYNMILYRIDMVQKYYSIPEDDFEWLARYGESLGHNKSSIVRVLIKERRALCEQERRDTGTTSLLKKPSQNRRDDDIENMPLYPIQ